MFQFKAKSWELQNMNDEMNSPFEGGLGGCLFQRLLQSFIFVGLTELLHFNKLAVVVQLL